MMSDDDNDGQMIFGDLGGLKLPDIENSNVKLFIHGLKRLQNIFECFILKPDAEPLQRTHLQ